MLYMLFWLHGNMATYYVLMSGIWRTVGLVYYGICHKPRCQCWWSLDSCNLTCFNKHCNASNLSADAQHYCKLLKQKGVGTCFLCCVVMVHVCDWHLTAVSVVILSLCCQLYVVIWSTFLVSTTNVCTFHCCCILCLCSRDNDIAAQIMFWWSCLRVKESKYCHRPLNLPLLLAAMSALRSRCSHDVVAKHVQSHMAFAVADDKQNT